MNALSQILSGLLLALGIGAPPEAPPQRPQPLLALGFDAPLPGGAEFAAAPGLTGKALRVEEGGVSVPSPAGVEWERGSVEMAICPGYDCKDDRYHTFFEAKGKGQGKVYLIKSGTGGANGLFLCAIDDGGKWRAASVFPGAGYSWRKGEWHRIGGSWDSRRGILKLFFDGREVKETRTDLFRLGIDAATFSVGSALGGGQPALGLVDDFRLYREVLTDVPLAAASASAPDGPPWKALDRSRSDGAGWTGTGCPNWLEVKLPQEQSLARVVVYPGDRRFAPYPSTELSPRTYRVQAYQAGKWRDLTGDVPVPRYRQGEHRIVSDFAPVRTRRFRIAITAITDEGRRIDGRVLPEAEREVVIREVEWSTAEEIRAERERLAKLRATIAAEVGGLSALLRAAPARGALGRALAERYGGPVKAVAADLAALSGADEATVDRFERRWAVLRAEVAPWAPLLDARRSATPASWTGEGRCALVVEVSGAVGDQPGASVQPKEDRPAPPVSRLPSPVPSTGKPGKGPSAALPVSRPPSPVPSRAAKPAKDRPAAVPVSRLPSPVPKGHTAYPLSVPLDLGVLEKAWGAELDPYQVSVTALDPITGKPIPWARKPGGGEEYRCPSRFDRVSPKQGRLCWTMRDAGCRRFLIAFRPRAQAPPETGRATLGDGDRLYYDRAESSSLPGPVTSAAILDWDGDGRQDLLTGAWTDHAHFWRNIGTRDRMAFSEYEHFALRDEEGSPILAFAEHPGLGFSWVTPADADGDGLEDLFVSRVYGSAPAFYRNLGPRSFPRLSRARVPRGLSSDRFALGDLNADGKLDALVARPSAGKTALLLQRGEQPDTVGTPGFAQPALVEVEGQPFTVGNEYVMPALADVDGDGDLDLSYYVYWGNVYLSENLGTAREPRFAPPAKLMRGGKPLDIGSYHHGIRWGDADGDGDLDLVCTTGVRIFRNEGDRHKLLLGEAFSPTRSAQVVAGPHRLQGFSFADWDGDGDLDRVMTRYTNTDLEVEIFQDGLFRESRVVAVDPRGDDWYGCPDDTEYSSLYSNTRVLDWDGDGDLDLFITSEHGWRYGYIHTYENRGGGKWTPEAEFRPGGTHDYVRFVEGKEGQGIAVDEKTWLDYLSYPTEGNFDPARGTLRFWFRPEWDSGAGTPHALFATEPNPSLSMDARTLFRLYAKTQEGLSLPPGFSLTETERGTLRLQLWERAVETPALGWKGGEWHRVEVAWGREGARIGVDGRELARSGEPVVPGKVGRRVYLGSRPVKYVQHEREYAGRRKTHPIDWIFPARGTFDEVEIAGSDGKPLLSLSFEGNCDGKAGESGDRLRVGYRCTPDFADLNGDGLLDMVMMVCDGTRPATGELFLFPNTGTGGQPRLGSPVPLKHSDGKPFHCFHRTQITCVDWDGDGRQDILLSTEHTTAPPESVPNQGLDFFRNEGTAKAPLFGRRVRLQKVIDAIQPWHEMKIATVDLVGDSRPDLVASADNGTFFFSRSYLEEKPLTVVFTGTVVR